MKIGDGRSGRLATGVLLALAACLVFVLAARTGGVTWDEQVHRTGAEDQFRIAAEWLAGGTADFRTIPTDLAFYGTVPIAAATAVDTLSAPLLGGPLGALAFGIWLHAFAFLLYGLAVVVAFAALRAAAVRPAVAGLGAAFLALYPLWLGYGLFDYKDMPTAALVVLVVYCAGRALAAEPRDFTRWTVFAVLATVALGGTKAAALSLVIVPWAALAYDAVRRRRWAVPVLAAAGIALGVLLVTPAAWAEPVAFFTAAVELMSRHPWGGCTLTDGACLSPRSEDWSAARYLWDWAIVQLPVLMIAGLVPALLVALWRGGIPRLAAATLLFTVTAIILRNTTLYDGLRHVIFTIPLAVIVLFAAIDEAMSRWGRPAAIGLLGLAAVELATFAVDDVRLFPYDYVYFNLAARGSVDESRYETEYWGFSAREAVRDSRSKQRVVRPITASPAHVFAVAFGPKATIEWRQDGLAESGYRGPYTRYGLSRGNTRPSPECKTLARVERTLLLGKPMLLSYAERCRL